MRKTKIILFTFIAVLTLFILAGPDNHKSTETSPLPENFKINTSNDELVSPKGSRLLGVGLSEGSIGFADTFNIAQELGIDFVELSIQWDDSEKEAGNFDPTWLPIADAFYPTHSISLGLGLNPIDTNSIRLPEYLKDKSFDDQTAIDAYKKYVTFASTQLKNTDVLFVAVGNEIDATLSSKVEWKEYTEFFKEVGPHVRKEFPGAKVGAKITLEGLFKNGENAEELISHSDVVLVTYYPFIDGTFDVKEPAQIHEDFERIVAMFPGKPIYIVEIGYPSGDLNSSSFEKQAEFVHEVFKAWDKYQRNIPLINFIWMHDISSAETDRYARYYGSSGKSFKSFLGTLGLRTNDGIDKPAFTQLRNEVRIRED